MRVLLLNHYYWPDVSANAQYGTQLAEDLVAAGMEVHAIASMGDYLGERRKPLCAKEEHNGVHVHRVPVTNFGKHAAWRRIADAVSFHVMSFLVALRIHRPDVIVTQTAPLLIVTYAHLLAWLRRAKLIVWCQDVWPDIAFALGLFRGKSFSGRIFRFFSYRSMRKADRVVAIGRCMERYLLDTVGLDGNVVRIQNWGDSDRIISIPNEKNTLRRELGLDGKVVVLYSGNMGWAHPFESIMEAVRELQIDPRIHFLFIGSGQRRPYIEERIRELKLTNVTLLPYQPYENLSLSLSAGDVHLISLDPRLDGLIVPSKVYAALAVQRPVILLGSERSEIAEIIRETDCGYVIPPDCTEELVRVLRASTDCLKTWVDKGARGGIAFRRQYMRKEATTRYARLIQELADS